MKTIIKYIGIAIFALSVFSCSKNDDINIEREQINYRVTSFYTGLGTFDISYNQNSLIETIQIPNGSTNAVDYNSRNKITSIGSAIYQYNDTNNIISIITENTEATVTYNAQGKIALIATTKVNTDNSVSHSTASFIYNANGMVDEIIENNTNAPTLTYRNRFTYDANLNITQVLEEETTDNINFILTRTRTITYDNKKSPYYATNNVLNEYSNISVYDLWNFYSSQLTRKSFQTVWHYSPNNYLTINKVTSTGATTYFNFENTYNSDDFVTLMDRTVTSSTGVETYAVYGFNYETY